MFTFDSYGNCSIHRKECDKKPQHLLGTVIEPPAGVKTDKAGNPLLTQGDLDSWQDNFTICRTNSSPNIDIASDGKIAITWAETQYFKTSIVFGDPYQAPENKVNILYKRGNVVGAQGVLGYPCAFDACQNTRVVDYGINLGGNHNVFGDPIAVQLETKNPRTYFENPDVAISEGAIISYAYVAQTYFPFNISSGSIVPNGLTTAQRTYNECTNVEEFFNDPYGSAVEPNHVSGYGTVFGNKPRIAAPQSGDYWNFTVVTGTSGFGCDGGGYYTDSPISVVGRHKHVTNTLSDFLLNGVIINETPNPSQNFYRQYIQVDPVIAYLNPGAQEIAGVPSNRNVYVVAWSILNVDGFGKSWDIIAKTYTEDDSKGVGNVDQYSMVDEMVSGVDFTPSVASRHASGHVGYAWANSYGDDDGIFNKPTLKVAGVDRIENDTRCGFDICSGEYEKSTEDWGLIGWPNPNDGSQSWQLDLPESAGKVQRIDLRDGLGRQVDCAYRIIDGKPVLQANRKLTPGSYKVRVDAENGSRLLNLVVN